MTILFCSLILSGYRFYPLLNADLMAIDLLDRRHGFDVKITVDCPSQAGWEIDNLTPHANSVDQDGCSLSTNSKRNGFIAAYFKKPPVNITIAFQHPAVVQIQKIIFCPVIGSQCSLAATISVRTSQKPERLVFVTKATWEPCQLVIFDGSQHFRSHYILAKPESVDNVAPSNKNKCFVLGRNSALGDTQELVLTISKTQGSSAVALQNLRIFGQPSLSIGREVYQNLASRITGDASPSSAARTTAPAACIPEESSPSQFFDETEEIPAKYLDPLTCNLMIDPVILPSGYIVDMSTLKRHEAAQMEMGRRLFDPFTGIHFTYAQVRNDVELRRAIELYNSASHKDGL